jgi:LacI family transcriptional regulator
MSLHKRLCKQFFQKFGGTTKMPTGPVTLEHVAQLAGVSASTASRALAGKARQYRISEKTEKAVLKVASGLRFQASHVARSLRTQRSGLIGLLVPDASNPFFAAIARQATIAAERHGMSTLLADSHNSSDHEEDMLVHLEARQVEGLIVCPIGDSSSHLEPLERRGANVVVVDRWYADVQLPTVTSENERGAFAAIGAMLDQGHRQIGCLQGRPGTSTNDERVLGYKNAMGGIGLETKQSLIRGDDFSEESGYRATCELLDTQPEITALFAFSNQNALGALRALGERGLKIPDDISLVTFDDAPFAEYLASPLSVVRQDVEAIGGRAAELLIEQIRTGRKPETVLHRIPVEFVSRNSIGPPRRLREH